MKRDSPDTTWKVMSWCVIGSGSWSEIEELGDDDYQCKRCGNIVYSPGGNKGSKHVKMYVHVNAVERGYSPEELEWRWMDAFNHEDIDLPPGKSIVKSDES